jgi:hypothetical protein
MRCVFLFIPRIIDCCALMDRDVLYGYWMDQQLLGAIGEAFEDADEICGFVVSVRKGQDRISIWTKSTKKEPCMRIG